MQTIYLCMPGLLPIKCRKRNFMTADILDRAIKTAANPNKESSKGRGYEDRHDKKKTAVNYIIIKR